VAGGTTEIFMLRLCDALDVTIKKAAGAAAYLIVVIAVVQITVSSLRYFFSVGSILLQELILNLNVVLVSLSICYGVLRNIHTRVDLLGNRQSEAHRLTVELACILGFMVPAVVFLTWALLPYVAQAWSTLEGSRNVGGLGGIYIIKSFLVLMSGLLILQALALLVRILLRKQWPYPQAADGPVEL
jgi:TRAP-type mannitol/chloroaromatic compound transport system permease small subunit